MIFGATSRRKCVANHMGIGKTNNLKTVFFETRRSDLSQRHLKKQLKMILRVLF